MLKPVLLNAAVQRMCSWPAVPIAKSNKQQQGVLGDCHHKWILGSSQVTQRTYEYGGSELETSGELAAVRKGSAYFEKPI